MPSLKGNSSTLEAIAAALRQNVEVRMSDINSLSSRVNPSSVWKGTTPELY